MDAVSGQETCTMRAKFLGRLMQYVGRRAVPSDGNSYVLIEMVFPLLD